MSFVDLAALAMHRRSEMEARIKVFIDKCNQAVRNVEKLKVRAQGFVEHLNCDPSELKERFLNCMKQLDEYTYLMTDFNLAIANLDESSSIDMTPVQDSGIMKALPAPIPFNLIDALSEPTPSSSKVCPNLCPAEKPLKRRIPKEDQLLIAFSSTSCSSESVMIHAETLEKEVQCKLTDDISKINLEESITALLKNCNLPAQTLPQTDELYPATIVHVDGYSFWVITDSIDDVYNLMVGMSNYYKENRVELSLEQVMSLTYCAYYEDDTNSFYRSLFIKLSEEDMSLAELYLVDTGETRSASAHTLQPLAPQFCTEPPYARCCHLAGIEMIDDNSMLMKQESLLKEYIGQMCSIIVDDNTSESLGIVVVLDSKVELNRLMVDNGYAYKIDKNNSKCTKTGSADPELDDASFDITQCPEYEDPVVAVTGYHNRDEADICKHYKGGPDKTCFKGTRCTKRHVVKHPDGWTLDRVPVPGKCRAVPLPAPGTWRRVTVTHVPHYNRFYVHLAVQHVPEPNLPSFGVVLPPTTLTALVQDMNSPAARVAYKPLKIIPAPGELVAALYPLDEQWYRARVLSTTRADQNVEVMYIDYGNIVWVKEDAVRALPARFCALPAQAARCLLAGAALRSRESAAHAAARHALDKLICDRTCDAHVVSRDYDEITVELFDESGFSIADHLAATGLVELVEYTVDDDTQLQHKLVVP